jgi:VCBS repeat-containing protein
MTLGTVTQNGNTFTYDPGDAFQYLTAGQIANDNFYYTLTDGIATNNAEVYLTITGVNNAPVNSVLTGNWLKKIHLWSSLLLTATAFQFKMLTWGQIF